MTTAYTPTVLVSDLYERFDFLCGHYGLESDRKLTSESASKALAEILPLLHKALAELARAQGLAASVAPAEQLIGAEAVIASADPDSLLGQARELKRLIDKERT